MRYRRVPNRARISGAEVATTLLGAHGLQRVRVEQTPGALSDHYDGNAGALRLSEPVATERSVAAMGIAAHEVSHAYQDADGNRAYRIRKAVAEPLAKFAPFSALFFIGGFWFGIPILAVLSLIYVAGLVVFALATLPVELGASRRALELLSSLAPRRRGGGRGGAFRTAGGGVHLRGRPGAPDRLLRRADPGRRGDGPRDMSI